MLSRIFKLHMRNVSTLILGLIVVLPSAVGCGGKAVEVTTPPDHPANPGAPQAVFERPSDVLIEEIAPTEAGDPEHRGSVSLSDEGEEALATMLDAYFAIGAQLASDTMDDVNAKAHAMLEAFHTLEHEASAELWSAHQAHTETLHDAGHELGDLADIKAARIAYGSLSDAFNHFVAAVGVPASYEKPVYSYVCGMESDVPEGGIWLQIGDNVRNPYFGSTMLKCHSEKAQMPVASANMSEHEQMDHREHKGEKEDESEDAREHKH